MKFSLATIVAVTASVASAADIPTTAIDAGSFETLVAALGAAELVDALSAEGPLTVFAPTADAFAALPAALVPCLLLPDNKDALTSILTYHVAAGSVMSADLSDDMEVPTLQGEKVTIDTTDGVKINNATVVIADVAADNGVIHAIDGVLVPPSIDVAAFLESCPEVEDEGSIIPEAISKAAVVEDDGIEAASKTSSGGGAFPSNANKIRASKSGGSSSLSSTSNIVWALVAATAFVVSASACMW